MDPPQIFLMLHKIYVSSCRNWWFDDSNITFCFFYLPLTNHSVGGSVTPHWIMVIRTTWVQYCMCLSGYTLLTFTICCLELIWRLTQHYKCIRMQAFSWHIITGIRVNGGWGQRKLLENNVLAYIFCCTFHNPRILKCISWELDNFWKQYSVEGALYLILSFS